jgi:hypothetical protein
MDCGAEQGLIAANDQRLNPAGHYRRLADNRKPRKDNPMKYDVKSTCVSPADAQRWGFKTLASVDNPKASKATKFGFLNAILYMSPAETAGVGNLCPWSGACAALCLGTESGQASMRKEGEDNNVTLARKGRARAFMRDRAAFVQQIVRDIKRLHGIATGLGLKLCYRFNGSTDVAVPRWLIELFPYVTFIDYTKSPNRMAEYLAGKFPKNYSLTFSRDVHNERLAERFLGQQGNVAVVFGIERPATWRGFPVVDGDKHDVRTPDMDGRGVVIGLTPKGAKAKRDQSGFIVRTAA